MLASCSTASLDDYRSEGQSITRELILELKQIRNRDDLLLHEERLQKLFNMLADVIVKADTYRKLHPEVTLDIISSKEHAASEELRLELNRILRMDGGKEVIEKAQSKALKKLHTHVKA